MRFGGGGPGGGGGGGAPAPGGGGAETGACAAEVVVASVAGTSLRSRSVGKREKRGKKQEGKGRAIEPQ